jgi:DNA mismatch repair protein MutS
MEGQIDGVVNYNVAAKKRGSDVTFLRKIVRGPTDDSYGIEVARLAGVPDTVTKRAREILKTLEEGKRSAQTAPAPPPQESAPVNYTFEDQSAEHIKETLRKLDLNTLTPIEAMNVLFSLQRELKDG